MAESSESSVTKMLLRCQNQPAKKIKCQEFVEFGKEDRISALPDCLLLTILSRLPSTKHAIRTGTLSKRWKHLWTLAPTLIFKHNDGDYWHGFSDFVEFVDETLTQCRQLKLKKFQVYANYEIRFESQVNNWIRYAIRCNVEDLKLMFSALGSEFVLDQNFLISSSFTDLTLESCILKPTGSISWKNLSLSISYGYLDEDLIENILSGSPVLETLELDYCHGYRFLNITSKSVKNLVFSGYMIGDDTADRHTIKINAPYILSLTIKGPLLLWKLLLVNVSSLLKANLDYIKLGSSMTPGEEMLEGFMLNLGHVKDLKIGFFCCEALICLKAKGFIFPSNVKLPGNIFHHGPANDEVS